MKGDFNVQFDPFNYIYIDGKSPGLALFVVLKTYISKYCMLSVSL